MGKCLKCGKKGLFLHLTESGLCYQCAMDDIASSQIDGFHVDKSKIIDFGKNIFYLGIDDCAKRFVYSFQSPNIDICFSTYNFSDLLDYEVLEDGITIAKSNAGKALVGGALFGVTGAIIGSSSKRRQTPYCTSLQLRMVFNSLENPDIIIPFIASPVQKGEYLYNLYTEIVNEYAALLSYIQANAPTPSTCSAASPIDEIRKLKELLDEGILTQEEFDVKKKQLLNI